MNIITIIYTINNKYIDINGNKYSTYTTYIAIYNIHIPKDLTKLCNSYLSR